MNVRKILTLVVALAIALGGLALAISFLSNQTLEKSSTEIIFTDSAGDEARTVVAGGTLAEKGNLQLGDFAFAQLSNDDSAAELISAEFDGATDALDSARIRVNAGSVLAVNLLFGAEITALDDRIAATNSGGSFVFEELGNSTRVRVLSGDVKLTFVDPESSETFEGVLLAGEEANLDDAALAGIFGAGDAPAQVAKWRAQIGKFSSTFDSEGQLLGRILEKLPSGKTNALVDFLKEKLIFNPQKKAEFYAGQVAAALGFAANGDSSELEKLLATTDATEREILAPVVARALPFARLFVAESLSPVSREKIARLAELESGLAEFAGVAALSESENLRRDLIFIFDDPTDTRAAAKFLEKVASGIAESDTASARWLLKILENDPRKVDAKWLDAWTAMNATRSGEFELANAIANTLELTDAFVQNARVTLAGTTLKELANLLGRASEIFSENSLETIAAAGNELRNRALFLASLSGATEFDENAYIQWIVARENSAAAENTETKIPAQQNNPNRVARPESELTKFLNADFPESATQIAEENFAVLAKICGGEPAEIQNYFSSNNFEVYQIDEYFVAFAPELVDAASLIFDTEGNFVVACGGNPAEEPVDNLEICQKFYDLFERNNLCVGSSNAENASE